MCVVFSGASLLSFRRITFACLRDVYACILVMFSSAHGLCPQYSGVKHTMYIPDTPPSVKCVWSQVLIPTLASSLDTRVVAVCNNAAWALGELAMQLGEDMRGYARESTFFVCPRWTLENNDKSTSVCHYRRV